MGKGRWQTQRRTLSNEENYNYCLVVVCLRAPVNLQFTSMPEQSVITMMTDSEFHHMLQLSSRSAKPTCSWGGGPLLYVR